MKPCTRPESEFSRTRSGPLFFIFFFAGQKGFLGFKTVRKLYGKTKFHEFLAFIISQFARIELFLGFRVLGGVDLILISLTNDKMRRDCYQHRYNFMGCGRG